MKQGRAHLGVAIRQQRVGGVGGVRRGVRVAARGGGEEGARHIGGVPGVRKFGRGVLVGLNLLFKKKTPHRASRRAAATCKSLPCNQNPPQEIRVRREHG